MPRTLFFFLYLAASLLVTAAAQAGQAADERLPVVEGGHAASHHGLLAEVLKQSAEQPLHFAMAAGPIWLSRCLTAVPWYGWAMVPALAYREWRQWPSKRWWDPALDAAFLVLGVLTATWGAPLPRVARRGRGARPTLLHLLPRRA